MGKYTTGVYSTLDKSPIQRLAAAKKVLRRRNATVPIGELSTAAGVPTKTIRYYETIGVLAAPSRTASGYRSYDRSSVDRLKFIRAAQAVGLTLGEIRGIVALRDRGETPCTHVIELIAVRATEVEQRIAELQHLRADLD